MKIIAKLRENPWKRFVSGWDAICDLLTQTVIGCWPAKFAQTAFCFGIKIIHSGQTPCTKEIQGNTSITDNHDPKPLDPKNQLVLSDVDHSGCQLGHPEAWARGDLLYLSDLEVRGAATNRGLWLGSMENMAQIGLAPALGVSS